MRSEPEFENEEDASEAEGEGDEGDEEGQPTAGSSGKDSDEGDEDGSGEGDESSEGDETYVSDDGAQDGRGGSEDPSDTGEQSRKPDPKRPPTAKEMQEYLEEVQEETASEIEQELEDQIEAVQQQEFDYEVESEEDNHYLRDATSEHAALVNKCAEEFRDAQVQQMPGWYVGQRSGKLDHRRYAKALQGYDTVFRRWREGINDAFDFEVVFLLDQSGSMYDKMDDASVSLWVLQRTFEECDGVVTVLGFSEGVSLLRQRGNTASRTQVPIYDMVGTTLVADALKEARRILSTSRKTIRMCVVISDGGFHDLTNAQGVIREMDYPVAIVGIHHDVSRWRGHKNVVHQQTIQDPSELVDVIQKLALELSEDYINRKAIL